MSGGFEVDTEVLRRHGTRVGQVAGDLGTAQAAAGSIDLHGGAFGVLCSFLPGIVSGVDSAARDAVTAMREATDGMITELGAMARSIDEADQRVEERMRSIVRVLDR
ncbi:type VII secretion target [Cellulomonas sp. Y8]|uniref:type VII secretion target n=1 Tax=Cellulomonas sp. Y8 TaxID=2591145 RepID=UPI003D7250A6